jgi:zinc/manganese transport system permease protein
MSFTDLLGQHFVHTALLAGAVVSVLAGAVGVFVVVRGMSFAVHAVSELGFTGAAGALVLGLDPVIGLLTGSVTVGAALGLLTVRGRERDSAIGSFLAFGLGVGVLLISIYQRKGYATQATNLLFGSIVGVNDRQLEVLAAVAVLVLVVLSVSYRPLLFASVDPEAAEARGVPLRVISVLLALLVALTTAEAIQVVGVLLVLTLVITPAAAAAYLTARPARAVVLSVAIAFLATEGGILLSLVRPYPTSFFVSGLSFVAYVVARGWRAVRGRKSPRPLDLRAGEMDREGARGTGAAEPPGARSHRKSGAGAELP